MTAMDQNNQFNEPSHLTKQPPNPTNQNDTHTRIETEPKIQAKDQPKGPDPFNSLEMAKENEGNTKVPHPKPMPKLEMAQRKKWEPPSSGEAAASQDVYCKLTVPLWVTDSSRRSLYRKLYCSNTDNLPLALYHNRLCCSPLMNSPP